MFNTKRFVICRKNKEITGSMIITATFWADLASFALDEFIIINITEKKESNGVNKNSNKYQSNPMRLKPIIS